MEMTPREIVAELDRFIVGQNAAKRAVAIALCNRWRRQRVDESLRQEIMPNNIILIGPTGIGKTELARRLARLAHAPFIKVEASKFTEVGYVGRDVESIVRDLVDISIDMIKSDRIEQVQDEAFHLAEERILDVLLPPPALKSEEEDPKETKKKKNAYNRSRKKTLEQLQAGELDDRKVELEVDGEMPSMMQVISPIGVEEMGLSLQDLFGPMMPKKAGKRRMNVAEALIYLSQEETHKLIDMDEIIREAIDLVEDSGIVFLDEIDKVASSETMGIDVSREGVQRDLLPIIEGTNVITKYGMVQTDHILFVAAGAFHVSKPSDLIPELQGRFPIRVEMDSLDADDFVKILTEPENSLIKQYKALVATEEVDLQFTAGAISEIAQLAFKVNETSENIGARRLHTIMTILLEEEMFNLDEMNSKKIKIDKQMVDERLKEIIANEDLGRYIL